MREQLDNHKIPDQLPVNKQLLWQREGEMARGSGAGDSQLERVTLAFVLGNPGASE